MSKNYSKYYNKDKVKEEPTSPETVSEDIIEKNIESIPEEADKDLVSEDTIEKNIESIPEEVDKDLVAEEPNKSFALVTGHSKVNMRSGTSMHNSVISIFPEGTKLEILDDSNKCWFKVTDGKVTGYMMSNYLKRI